VRHLQAAIEQLRAAEADVVVIYRQDAETIARTRAGRGVAFDCLSDPDSALELAAQIERFRPTRYAAFSPVKLVRALRDGGRVGALKTDLLQGRAFYVVGRDGRVVYVHVSANAADVPPTGAILDAVRAAAWAMPGPRGVRSASAGAVPPRRAALPEACGRRGDLARASPAAAGSASSRRSSIGRHAPPIGQPGAQGLASSASRTHAFRLNERSRASGRRRGAGALDGRGQAPCSPSPSPRRRSARRRIATTPGPAARPAFGFER
jgi:peroxiredoxin